MAGPSEGCRTMVAGDMRERMLHHRLLDENMSFAEWLRQQIDAYLAEKEPKGKRGKGKEA